MTREKFKQSIEIKYNIKAWFFYIILSGIIVLIFLAGAVVVDDFESFGKLFRVLLILPGIFIYMSFYYLYRAIYLSKNFNNYIFQEVKLSDFHTYLGSRLYFTVDIKLDNRKIIRRDTNVIFGGIFGILSLSFNEYVNKTVLIGYNLKSDEIIVIG